jgi:hypothetical protein
MNAVCSANAAILNGLITVFDFFDFVVELKESSNYADEHEWA